MKFLFFLMFFQFFLKISTRTVKNPSVIIIGAGPAGIAAASKLFEAKWENVQILEAENRIGGRINSVFFGNAYVDLGAEWCHGEKDNVVFELAKNFSILQHSNELKPAIYHSSKKKIDFSEELLAIMEEIYAADGNREIKEGTTLGEFCMEQYNSTIYTKFQKYPEKLEVAKASLVLFHHWVISSEGAFTWFEPSAKNDYRECGGDSILNWNGLGYKTILDILMKKFPKSTKQSQFDGRILLNKEVSKILYDQTMVQLECLDNSTFQADHVIFTPSVGVLKAQHEQLFSPALPKNKVNAIGQIGFGAVMKIFMHFEQTWWPSTFSYFAFVWSDEDKVKLLQEFPYGPNKNGRSWLTDCYALRRTEDNPQVIVAWLSGELIPEIELIDDQIVIDGVTHILKKFLNHQFNITKPQSIIRSFWYTNPHFRGTYSYQTVQARKNNESAEVELAKPLLNSEGKLSLQFAGEASHPYYYSTVHGAIETGFREADRLINLYKE